MRAHQDRCVPVEPLIIFIRARLRLDGDHLTCGYIDTRQVSLLPFDVDNVRIPGLGGGLMPVPVQNNSPIRVLDAVKIVRPGRSALRAAVLGAAIDVVERLGVVDGDLIKLAHGKISDVTPVLGLIEAFVEAAVITQHDIVWIAVLESHGVTVTVAEVDVDPVERTPAVYRELHVFGHQVDPIELMR